MENFNTNDEVVDLEEYAKKGEKPPKARKYRITIDREKFIVDKECMTGREILVLAGKTPVERFQLRLKFVKGTVVTIEYDQSVCFTEPGIEKFKTIPLDQTEGEVPKRDFTLLEEDEEYLNSLGLLWETVNYGNAQWVFIHNYPIPDGYNVKNVNLGIRISPGYPTAQLDMLYFNPPLQRVDGLSVKALSVTNIDGKLFQQWSRHRTANNPWRPGIDNLSTHVPLADAWLKLEFLKQPTHAISA